MVCAGVSSATTRLARGSKMGSHWRLYGQAVPHQKREKDTDHPYHCYLGEAVVKDRSIPLQVQGPTSFFSVPPE